MHFVPCYSMHAAPSQHTLLQGTSFLDVPLPKLCDGRAEWASSAIDLHYLLDSTSRCGEDDSDHPAEPPCRAALIPSGPEVPLALRRLTQEPAHVDRYIPALQMGAASRQRNRHGGRGNLAWPWTLPGAHA